MNEAADGAAVVGQADAALGRGDPAMARMLLERAFDPLRSPFDLCLRLATLRRMGGDRVGALAATTAALSRQPLDFVALLLRARLLEDGGDEAAGEAYGNALAQRPPGDLPPSVAPLAAHAERRRDEHAARREARLADAMAAAEAGADGDRRWRYARFRGNVSRRTRAFHSEPTHFDFPGLAEREFHPRARFPWLAAVEAATDAIAADLDRVMAAERAELVPYIQYDADQPMRQWLPLNRSSNWTAIHLLRGGEVVDANARHCRATLDVLRQVPQPALPGRGPNAMFSLLAPRTRIPPHTGVSNTRLVCHLPLVVPDRCWFRVGAETRNWRRGEAFVFDDTIEHEAANDGDRLRVVLIFDLWHPDLDDRDRAAVTALMGAEAAGPSEL